MDFNPVFVEITKTVGAITAGALGQMVASWWRRRNKLPQGFDRLEEMCKRQFAESERRQGDLALAMVENKRELNGKLEEIWHDVIGLRVSVARIRGRLKLNGEAET